MFAQSSPSSPSSGVNRVELAMVLGLIFVLASFAYAGNLLVKQEMKEKNLHTHNAMINTPLEVEEEVDKSYQSVSVNQLPPSDVPLISAVDRDHTNNIAEEISSSRDISVRLVSSHDDYLEQDSQIASSTSVSSVSSGSSEYSL